MMTEPLRDCLSNSSKLGLYLN